MAEAAPRPDLPPLRDVIVRHRLGARRSLGQHFLLDLNLTRRIARAAGPLDGAAVYEVGPGPGGLTRALLAEGAGHVIAVERDPRCIAALEELRACEPGRLTLVEADALMADERALIKAAGQGREGVKVVANLPYNIATALLVKWLETGWPPFYASLTLMFQKEVAERITARPGGKEYGRLAVLAQWRSEARILFDVSPKAFVPPPKVTSSVVRLIPREEPVAEADPGKLAKVTQAAFGQRRKMLRTSLKAITPDSEALLARAGIAPTRRAEELDIAEFCTLARAYEAMERAGSREESN